MDWNESVPMLFLPLYVHVRSDLLSTEADGDAGMLDGGCCQWKAQALKSAARNLIMIKPS